MHRAKDLAFIDPPAPVVNPRRRCTACGHVARTRAFAPYHHFRYRCRACTRLTDEEKWLATDGGRVTCPECGWEAARARVEKVSALERL